VSSISIEGSAWITQNCVCLSNLTFLSIFDVNSQKKDTCDSEVFKETDFATVTCRGFEDAGNLPASSDRSQEPPRHKSEGSKWCCEDHSYSSFTESPSCSPSTLTPLTVYGKFSFYFF
jgi:hypothetical protein